MKSGYTLIFIAVALTVGGFAGGYQFSRQHADGVAAAPTATEATAGSKKKLLYYRNPMGLPDTSPVPKKDPMGMDYIPVYEGEEAGGDDGAGNTSLKISAEKVQKMGVKAEPAKLQALDRTVRASGRVEIDESRTTTVTAKFEGYIERLHVNTTGQPVGRGQPLFEVYSPELVSAQREYAIAAQGVGQLSAAGGEAQGAMQQLAESSLQRLKNWDISDEQIKALARSGNAKRTLTFRAPAAGIVTEKKAIQGMRFMPGDVLYQIADTSSVWVQADVFEQDIAAVGVGQKANIRISAYPGEVFAGRIAYVYPTLKAETRTVPVRIELANPKGRLKPAMFAEVEIPVAGAGSVVSVPNSAVIDTGKRQVVIVQLGEGRFEPRVVRLGARGGEFVQVLEGVKDGDMVVTAANFLIDAESNLKAALGGMQKTDLPSAAAKPAVVGHKGVGVLNAFDAASGTVTISHEPVASLKWPAMKMDFVLANGSLGAGLKPGAAVDFEFVERSPGEWVVTSLVVRK
ncbi:efflux RND transporter periplasmic adaptor subunit [Dechloromonas sp. XY25]|uniref:Efflux RND transporter periplasmic adaptor subunit n=1 Tax=Dechloromonas hankyongensis TaxID=2908002 RepID=A0ABS9K184_9RHOO|nr:efflux RND transporter periplasmic adaptor subunit [Dechloromonas hankyongensis]MCG2576929.1 efflux RND transporter periplasmic adaptor subunit [Dechloromonas hankyongensis]